MYNSLDTKLKSLNNCKQSYCVGCLSADRTLSSLNEYADIYRSICDISHDIGASQILMCWECMAVLKRIKIFKIQVAEAQRTITCITNKQNTPNTLSRLKKTYKNDVIFITHNDKMEPKLDIKQEIDKFDDDLVNCDRDINYSERDIKKGIQIKKEIKNKTQHYRYVYDTDVTKKSLLTKKLCIKESEIELWLEKEKSSEFYRSFKYKCQYCVQGWNFKEKLAAHTLKYHDESIGSYICLLCSSRFATETAQTIHMLSHSTGYECICCGHQFYTTRRLNAHLGTHRKLQCIHCEARFSDLPQFIKHYKSTHSVFICDKCDKRCKSKHVLEKHMSHHSDSHTCTDCYKRYKSLAALRKHFAMKHRSTLAEQAYCVLCDKQYNNALMYKRHVQTSAAHAHERGRSRATKPIICPECGNSYSRRIYMMNHYRHVHMNQSKYYCRDCDKNFLNRTRYIDHLKYNHQGVRKEKNKLCNVCGKGFSTNRVLINHIRTHSGERPFECESCGAKFTQKHSMVAHTKNKHKRTSRQLHC